MRGRPFVDPVPGTLAGLPGDARESVGQSLWYDMRFPTPYYGTPVVEADAAGGTVRILVQGSKADVDRPGWPVDPETDPERLNTTDWVGVDEIDTLDYHQFVRFRVTLTTAPDGGTTGRVPVVREIRIPVHSWK
ncbi:MAG: hypothetical protein ABFS86_04555 [Planctomycetota bacterium]